MATVEIERRGTVTLLTLNRPEVHNCIDAGTAQLLGAGIADFGADESARVLVVTGAGGRAFSTGFDLRDTAALLGREPDDREPPLGFAHRDPGKPTIAAIEGHALAGGLELACWCDWRIAGAGATFGVLNRRWGIPLVDGGTQRLPRIVGLSNALYLIETGVVIDERRALAMGLVQEVTPLGGALERALQLAGRLAAYPWQGLLADRANVLAAPGMALHEGLRAEAQGIPAAVADPEMADGLRRYAAGDRPAPPVAR